jgi:carboxyl-terminal processing protease
MKIFTSLVYIIIAVTLSLTQSPAYAHGCDLSGTWRSRGYGYILKIDALQTGDSKKPFSSAMIFNETAVSLLPRSPVRIFGKDLFLDDKLLGTICRRGNTLKFRYVENGTVIIFDLLSSKEESSSYEITAETDDPVANFDVFWHTFEENCALFPLTRVDWHSIYDRYRPQVTQDTTPQELFEIFTQMLTPLNDGHTALIAKVNGEDLGFSPGPTPRSSWMIERIDDMKAVISSYLDGNTLNEAVKDSIYYGTINQSIGYLNIMTYEGYSESDLDAALFKLQDAEALIIDIRMNDGGFDGLACALAGRLTNHKFIGYFKQVRIGGYDEFSEPTPIHITPAGVQFLDKPVIVLTSSNTMSAAEVQTMILKNPALPNVTLIGETTYGIFSNMLEKTLPNGWEFSLSNERYLSADNEDYEQIGIRPDIEEIGSEAALDNAKDNILERALRELRIDSN